MWVSMCILCMPYMHIEELWGVNDLLPPCGFWEMNSGCQSLAASKCLGLITRSLRQLFASAAILVSPLVSSELNCQEREFCLGQVIISGQKRISKRKWIKGTLVEADLWAALAAVTLCICASPVTHLHVRRKDSSECTELDHQWSWDFSEKLTHCDAWSQKFMQLLFYLRKIFSNCGHSPYFNNFREGLLTP